MTYRIKYPVLNNGGQPILWEVSVKKRSEAIEFAYQNEKVKLQLLQKENGKWVEFHKSTYCRRCGRTLTDPRSVANGIGPECIKHVNVNIGHLSRQQKWITEYMSAITGSVELNLEASTFIMERVDLERFKHCNEDLPMMFMAYPHEGGMQLPSYPERMWVYAVCPRCGYQLAWVHFQKRE